MADGYFKRGEVYWCRIDHNIGGEMGVTRPAVIVSKNENNSKYDSVTIAWLTSRPKEGSCYVNTIATGRESWIITSQLYTVDKTRFSKFMGKLSYGETRELDAALEDSLDLGYDDTAALEAKDKEIAARDEVIAKMEQQIVEMEAQVKQIRELSDKKSLSMIVELEKVNKMYFAALDKLVDIQFERDYNERVARRAAAVQHEESPVVTPPVVGEVEVVPEPPVEETPKEGDDKVDLNTCTLTRLKKLGFTMAMAREIVKHRPYSSVEDLKKVPGLKNTMFNIIKSKVKAAPKKETQFQVDPGYEEEEPQETVVEEPGVETEVSAPAKVNINTATAKEIMEALGTSAQNAYAIVGFRKKHGRFLTVDELTQAPRIGKTFMSRYREQLEV